MQKQLSIPLVKCDALWGELADQLLGSWERTLTQVQIWALKQACWAVPDHGERSGGGAVGGSALGSKEPTQAAAVRRHGVCARSLAGPAGQDTKCPALLAADAERPCRDSLAGELVPTSAI